MKLILLFFIAVITFNSYSQVGIGTTDVNEDALLELDDANKGFLINRVSLNSRQDVVSVTPSATEGLMVYNTNNAGAGSDVVSPGFYFWNGSEWGKVFSEGYHNQAENYTFKWMPPIGPNDAKVEFHLKNDMLIFSINFTCFLVKIFLIY